MLPRRPRDLHVHLQNHWATATVGVDLAHRVARSHRGSEIGPDLADVAEHLEEDRAELARLMQQAGVRPATVVPTLARLGERLGRLKPNGHLLQRSPVSDVLELEGLTGVVATRAAGWVTLVVVAGHGSDLPQDRLQSLHDRALAQLEVLDGVHRRLASQRAADLLGS